MSNKSGYAAERETEHQIDLAIKNLQNLPREQRPEIKRLTAHETLRREPLSNDQLPAFLR